MDKWEYINAISGLSDRYGSELVNMMIEYNAKNLQEISEEQAKKYYEKAKKQYEKQSESHKTVLE